VEKLLEVIRQTGKKNFPINGFTSVGTVSEIDDMTCTVEREGLPPLLDVRLNAIAGNFENLFLIIPEIGSQVLCLVVEGENAETSIVKYTEIEKIIITIAGARFEMSAGKFEFKNEESDLKEILTKSFDLLKNAIVTTPSGPGQFSDPDKLKIEKLKEETKNLFK